jgi:hypothetical protein
MQNTLECKYTAYIAPRVSICQLKAFTYVAFLTSPLSCKIAKEMSVILNAFLRPCVFFLTLFGAETAVSTKRQETIGYNMLMSLSYNNFNIHCGTRVIIEQFRMIYKSGLHLNSDTS